MSATASSDDDRASGRVTVTGPAAPPPPRRQRTFFEALRYAWHGLLYTALHQRNMKVHIVSALLVALVGSGIPLGLAEKVTLIFCVMLVFFAEILNASLEALVDLHTDETHRFAAVTKDAAAAGVLVLALGTVVIFAALIVHNWPTVAASGAAVARQAGCGVPLAVLAGLLIWSRPRPRAVDHALFVAGLVLLGFLARWTTSTVFTLLAIGLFLFARIVASHRPQKN